MAQCPAVIAPYTALSIPASKTLPGTRQFCTHIMQITLDALFVCIPHYSEPNKNSSLVLARYLLLIKQEQSPQE
jgi:hypothetical protein